MDKPDTPAYETDTIVSKKYKEKEMKEDEWWTSYLRVREDLTTANGRISRTGNAINVLEEEIFDFQSSVNQAIADTNSKMDDNQVKTSDKIAGIDSELKETKALVDKTTKDLSAKVDNSVRSLLDAISKTAGITIRKNQLAVDESKAELGKISKVETNLSDKIANLKTEVETNLYDKIANLKTEVGNSKNSIEGNKNNNSSYCMDI